MSAILNGEIKQLPDWIIVTRIVAACLAHAEEAGKVVPPDLRDEEDWRRRYFDLEQDMDAAARARRHSQPAGGRTVQTVHPGLKQPLDRLPPDTIERGDIASYLRMLINWLSKDPWPRDRRLGGPELTPAAIECKLRLTAISPVSNRDLDADDLVQHCQRLVILGSPGSGKTWLAKRAARRCAEKAIQALAAGGTAEEIELPLYTTCSRLFSAGGDIRAAAVSSALEQLGDLGSSRLAAGLRAYFTERNAATLLVIDSLDEAYGSDERLRQVGTLPWRVILTTRPSSWNNQLTIEKGDSAHFVGEIQPLRYPYEVEPFIRRWFDQNSGSGSDLVSQIRRRRALQRAATVPLVLAFYCIVGGTDRLPGFRRDLYTRVLKRMLTGLWRGNWDRQADVDACLQTLRAWAWSGATTNPDSVLGAWVEDIPTDWRQLAEAEEHAVDHVAAPLGPPDVDTGVILRRFVHRSIREHLVAEHVASLSVDHAAQVLLPHIWYDPDWEYSVPAALAMHPKRDQLLRALMIRAAASDQIPEDLAVIDGGQEFRRLLTRVAAESSETDWSPEIVEMIGKVRVEFAQAGRIDDLEGTAHWMTSNRQAREALLGLLPPVNRWGGAEELVSGIVHLAPTAEDKRDVRGALLSLLASHTHSWVTYLVRGLLELDPTAEDIRAAREVLLRLIATQDWFDSRLMDGIVQLARSVEDRRATRERLVAVLSRRGEDWASFLLRGVIELAPTPEDKRHACDLLLEILARRPDDWAADKVVDGVVQLATAPKDRRHACMALVGMLNGGPANWAMKKLLDGVVQLAPTPDEKRTARDALLGMLASQTNSRIASWLLRGMLELEPTSEDMRLARDALLGMLASQTDSRIASWLLGMVRLEPAAMDKRYARPSLLTLGWDDGAARGWLPGQIVQLATTAADSRRALDALLGLLASQAGNWAAGTLVRGIIELAGAAEDKRRAREVLLGLATRSDRWVAKQLMDGVIELAPTAEDKRHARDALLGLLASETDPNIAQQLAAGLLQLDPGSEDRRQARDVLLGLLASRAVRLGPSELLDDMAHFARTPEDKRQARATLLRMLTKQTDGGIAEKLAGGLLQLDPDSEDRRQARDVLISLLVVPTNRGAADKLADRVLQLLPTIQDKQRTAGALLERLAGESGNWTAKTLVDAVVQVASTAADKRRATETMLKMLTNQADHWVVLRLIDGMKQLDLTAEDKRSAQDLLFRRAAQADGDVTLRLIDAVIEFAISAEDKRRTREELLGLLPSQTDSKMASKLVERTIKLAATVEDKRRTREVLLGLLPGMTDNWMAKELVDGAVQLDLTDQDKRQVRQALLGLLARPTSDYRTIWLMNMLAGLALTNEDQRRARDALVGVLVGQRDPAVAARLIDGLVQLGPTVSDLSTCRDWAAPPTDELLAAVRQNSPLAVWIKFLPSLTGSSADAPKGHNDLS